MSERKDGNNAFPANWDTPVASQGMSLRDWFAGQALASIIAADGAQYMANPKSRQQHAEVAYAHADAMLAERERK